MYGDVVPTLRALDPKDAAALAHKFKGAAAYMALSEVPHLAEQLYRHLQAGTDPTPGLDALQRALDTALASAAKYAQDEDPTELTETVNLDLAQLKALLTRLLQAFDTDRPSAIRPVLAELGRALPMARLQALHTAIEDFDFRGGESATHALAHELGLNLGD